MKSAAVDAANRFDLITFNPRQLGGYGAAMKAANPNLKLFVYLNGTFLYKQAVENGWLDAKNAELIDEHGVQIAPLHYPHLSHTEIHRSVEEFYKRFYFRASKIAAISGEMLKSPQMMKRRLREGVEFFHFLREREMAH